MSGAEPLYDKPTFIPAFIHGLFDCNLKYGSGLLPAICMLGLVLIKFPDEESPVV